jgi:hypothetical protein
VHTASRAVASDTKEYPAAVVSLGHLGPRRGGVVAVPYPLVRVRGCVPLPCAPSFLFPQRLRKLDTALTRYTWRVCPSPVYT